MTKININDYDYPLPEERIAKFPLEERDSSKLLVYRQGEITERHFRNIGDELPEGERTARPARPGPCWLLPAPA